MHTTMRLFSSCASGIAWLNFAHLFFATDGIPQFRLELSEPPDTADPQCWRNGAKGPCRVETVVAYNDACTEYFDGSCDAYYLNPCFGPPGGSPKCTKPQLGSVIRRRLMDSTQTILTINGRPASSLKNVQFLPLYHYAAKVENYTIALTEVQEMSGHEIYLLDTHTGSSHLMNDGPFKFLGDPTDDLNDYPGIEDNGSDRYSLLVTPKPAGSCLPSPAPSACPSSSIVCRDITEKSKCNKYPDRCHYNKGKPKIYVCEGKKKKIREFDCTNVPEETGCEKYCRWDADGGVCAHKCDTEDKKECRGAVGSDDEKICKIQKEDNPDYETCLDK